MKKIIGIIAGVFFILLGAIILFPYVYKDKINRYIKTEINKKFNAKIDYKDVSLSLIKDFPNLHVTIEGITVDGNAPFDTIRLADIPEFRMSLNFKKLFTDENLEIKKFGLKNPNFQILVLKDGKANYNILKETENEDSNSDNSFDLKIKELKTDNLNLVYDDQSMNLKINLEGLNQTGKGNFKQDEYIYNTDATAKSLDVYFDSIHYLNKVKTKLNGKMIITNNFNTYTMKDIKARLNDLGLISNLFFDLQGDDIKMDINYSTEENNLKKFLSLIPPAYMPDLPEIQTKGEASLKGFVRGIYNDQNYPAYGVDFFIKNGWIKYPDLPESIKDIQVATKIDFPGGENLDNTNIDMSNIHFSIAQNPVNGYFKIKYPTTDPLINTSFNGKIDFNKVQQALKLKKSGIKNLQGKLDADFKLLTRMSAIEKENYDKVKASGKFNLKNVMFQTDSLPYSISIPKANFTITPAYLDVQDFNSKIGTTDLALKGKLDNYLAYALKKNKVLKADFNLQSKLIDLNQFMSKTTDEKNSPSDSMSVIRIPKNIDVHFTGKADKVLYKDMTLNNVKGDILIKDEKALLNTVLSKALGGEMSLKGNYDTSKKTPVSKLKMEMQKVSIPETASKISTFSYYAPALKKVDGQLFSMLDMGVELDEHMNPVFSSLDLNGLLETANIKVAGIEVLSQIAGLLKLNELKKPKIDKVKAHFIIEKGNLRIKPFDFKMNGMKSKFQGKVSLDRKIDFILDMDIPKDKLGNKANEIMENLIGKLSKYGLEKGILPDIIKMKFRITGDYDHPKVSPVFAGYEGKSAADVITEVVTDKVNKTVDQAKEKAIEEAKKQGEKLVDEAQVQAEKVKKEAHIIAEKIRKEAKKQADDLIKKAGDNAFQKLLAQKAAKKIMEKANDKADLIEKNAQEKADLLVNSAKEKSNLLIEKAKSTGN